MALWRICVPIFYQVVRAKNRRVFLTMMIIMIMMMMMMVVKIMVVQSTDSGKYV